MMNRDFWEILSDAIEEVQEWAEYEADMETNPWAE